MSKKVLIVTIPAGPNYGNRLQSFAVEQTLRDLGYEPSTLWVTNVRKDESLRIRRSFWNDIKPDYVKRYLKSLRPAARVADEYRQERLERFEQFNQQHIHRTPYTVSQDNLPFVELDQYDFAVCGSDQIWNPQYGYPALYYLDFVPKHKRVALSPSLAADHLEKHCVPVYKRLLSDIPYLSVREQRGAEIASELTGREIPALQDPTLWVGADVWRGIAKQPDTVPQTPYLLCYFLGEKTKKYQKRIAQYANAHGLQVISIADGKDLAYYATGPSEFLYLVDHAAMVCTDSFHGVAFSLIFNRPFAAFERTDGKGMETRIPSIMQCVGLDRWQQNVDCKQALDMSFTQVNEALGQLKESAWAYVQRAAQEIEKTACMPDLAPDAYCNGCRACQSVCPVGAIDWVQDQEGFFRPRVNADACIKCGKCQSVCPVKNRTLEQGSAAPEAFAAWTLDDEIRLASSSGGIFSVLAGEILERGGVVFGAGFDAQWHVRHRYIESAEQLPLLRTSKYVQSDVGDCYRQAKEFLEADRWVYFSGTPCQVQGLRAYLGKEYEKLILQDLVCHGVPSEKTWDAYLSQKHGGADAVQSVSFRDKTLGWSRFGMRIGRKGKKDYVRERAKDDCMKAFSVNLNLRPSCYACVNKTVARKCDVTLADFWGIQHTYPDLDTDKGVSLVLLQSEKGKRLFADVADKIYKFPTDTQRALRHNSAATVSVKKQQAQRHAFFAEYERDYVGCIKRIYRISPYTRVRTILGKIKYRVIKIIKK